MVMTLLRQSTKPIIWSLVIVVGVGFVLMGANLGSRRPGEKGIIGEVAGQDIRDEAYRQRLNFIYYQRNQQNRGEELSEAEHRQLRDDLFNTMVQEILFGMERERMSIQLLDDELVEHLRRFPPDFMQAEPSFMTDGAFDYAKYQQAMNDPQYGQLWAQVEGIIGPQLEQLKLQEFVVSLPHVTDPEVKLLFASAEEKRKVRHVAVRITDYVARVTDIDSAAVDAYYQDNLDEFYRDEAAELEYVTFDKLPSSEDTAVVFNELMDLRRRILDGEDFAELARLYSDEPQAAQSGGDLGWFGRKMMVPAFDSVAFALDTGVISEPVASRFGYHLIKVHEKRTVNDSDQVRAGHILLKVEISGRTMSDLQLMAQTFTEDLEDIPLDSLAASYGLNIITTGTFTRGSSIRGLGRDQAIEELAFGEEIGTVSGVIDKENYYVVCRIKERHPAGYQPLSEIRSRVSRAVKMDMAADSALAEIRKVANEVSAGKSLTDAAKTYNREATETDFFGRFDQVPGMGIDPAYHGMAFAIGEENPVSPIFKAAGSYCIVEYVDRQDSDMELYTAQRDSLFQVVLNGKQNQLYQLWYNDIYEEAGVKDYRYQIAGGY